MLRHTSVQTPVGEAFTHGSILTEEINYKVCLSLQEATLTLLLSHMVPY